jgi:hypothetical protein
MKRGQHIYYKFNGILDMAEILGRTLNRLHVRIKRPLCYGDVLELQHNERNIFAEVISQTGCNVVLWER